MQKIFPFRFDQNYSTRFIVQLESSDTYIDFVEIVIIMATLKYFTRDYVKNLEILVLVRFLPNAQENYIEHRTNT